MLSERAKAAKPESITAIGRRKRRGMVLATHLAKVLLRNAFNLDLTMEPQLAAFRIVAGGTWAKSFD